MPHILSASTATTSTPRRLARQSGLVLLGTLFLTASAYLSIPMPPVPVSMETFAVVMVGALFGRRLGGITIVAWLLEGALGLPVLAGGTGGIIKFFGPTAGYLFSYPLMGALAGWLMARGGCHGGYPVRAFSAALGLNALCLFLGAVWLAALAGPGVAWASGVEPFIPGEILKAALVAATLASWHSAKRYARRR